MTDLKDLDPFHDLTDEEREERVTSAKAKLQKHLGFSDEKFAGYTVATDHVFVTRGLLSQSGLLLPEQGMAIVAVLADVSLGRGGPEQSAATPALH
jgi:hypothetical protein